MIGTLTGNGHDLIKLGQEMELINEVPYLMNAGMKILKIGLMRDVRMVALAQKPSGSYVIGVDFHVYHDKDGKIVPYWGQGYYDYTEAEAIDSYESKAIRTLYLG